MYYFELSLGGDKLNRVKIEGLDVGTFEEVPGAFHLWYRDANRVYFGTWATLRVCPEIDRNTFEILSMTTSKDKNNVYYLTRGLESEGERATERDNYAILKGADAPTFRKVDEHNYRDKNTTWTIGNSHDHRRNRPDAE